MRAHVRESGFHSKHGRPELVSMSTRNAKIETYHKAVDFLVERIRAVGAVDALPGPDRGALLELLEGVAY